MNKPKLISYYDDGWRYGYIEETEDNRVRIKPIGAIGSHPNTIWMKKADIRDI
jgi:hypothetical protein